MASDGGSGPEGRPIRRPVIRRRAITAPRVATSARPLPPPRAPVAKQLARPRLQLIVDDEMQMQMLLTPAPSVGPRSSMPWAIGAVAAALALAFAIGAVWFVSRPASDLRSSTRTTPEPLPVSTTTVNAGSVAMLAPPARVENLPDVPAVDVKSLPTAPRRAAPRVLR